MKKLLSFICFILLSAIIYSQSCSILSKANNITPNKLCSPVTVSWNVSYTGVDDGGKPVQIRYDWNDGAIQTVPAVSTGPGIYQATVPHVYTSRGNVCNYLPQATLIVNGVLCTSSSQQQIVTVWDDDNHNGGHMHINPAVYPICVGNGDNVRFQDLTQFNCVPPHENDVPNLFTRWVQWIYGTDITMTGIPVTVNGSPKAFPYSAPIITLTGPVAGSGVFSDFINVANDKQVGQYFQVTLRNWNYCNPYDDPNIPGPPADAINGDHPPVTTTAIIRIDPYPDATINPVGNLCQYDPPVTLTAHDSGGTWSGPGVTGDIFDPSAAGAGTHTIKYSITTGSGCTNSDQTTITVLPSPDATIAPIGILCYNNPVITLTANDSGGTWSGTGVAGNTFNPAAAGTGNHIITYNISNINGCGSSDQITITVVPLPDATITPVDTMCVNNPAITLETKETGGVWSGAVSSNTFNPASAGVGDHIIKYTIINNNGCSDSDQITISVMPLPTVNITHVGNFFINSPSVTLNATPVGGIFSGAGMIGSVFTPNSAGLGTHIIQYQTVPDRFGCATTDTIHIKVIMPALPVASFVPDTVGCSPLKVQFVNNSLYGESYLWDFGDKVFSVDRDPSHIYFSPGSFIVKLTVSNISGQSMHTVIITVYQNPTAVFNAYPTEVTNNSQIVIFSNYSYFDDSQLWTFGDGVTSTEKNPWHKYESEGTYNITLIVTSKDGCVDSAHFISPVHVKFNVGKIKFPNAFVWNREGPTGGYWHEGNINDFIFRPHFENVIEYNLKIFNRLGVLIYESNDLQKGWDGYFGNGYLALEGVYVWRAKGRFADGKYFDDVGDVTFLH